MTSPRRTGIARWPGAVLRASTGPLPNAQTMRPEAKEIVGPKFAQSGKPMGNAGLASRTVVSRYLPIVTRSPISLTLFLEPSINTLARSSATSSAAHDTPRCIVVVVRSGGPEMTSCQSGDCLPSASSCDHSFDASRRRRRREKLPGPPAASPFFRPVRCVSRCRLIKNDIRGRKHRNST